MPLREYQHRETGELRRSLHQLDLDVWELILSVPNVKFMEKVDSYKNKSRIKGLKGILTARSRNHMREVDQHDQVQVSKMNGMEESARRNLLNEKGEKRRKIDDL